MATNQADIASVQYSKLELKDFEDFNLKLNRGLQFIKSDVQAVNSSIRDEASYLEKFYPLKIQSQIDETLRACLDSRTLTKMISFNDDKIKQLNLYLLEEIDLDLVNRTQNVLSDVERMEKLRLEERAQWIDQIASTSPNQLFQRAGSPFQLGSRSGTNRA